MTKPKNPFYDIPKGWMFLSLLICIIFIGIYSYKATTSTSSTHFSQYYTVSDFQKVPKIDVHFHYNTADTRFLEFADSLNFRLISPNVDTEMSINTQFEITRQMKQNYPDKFAFWGTFSVDSFGSAHFCKETLSSIRQSMEAGASGIKIWKNIGMTLRDKAGRFVMADDVHFDTIFNYLEKKQIPLIAHLGEPKNCWLPVEKMTTPNDKRYYLGHPQYHMFLHPEYPSYEDQIRARNHLMVKHPDLAFIGAHLASEEWSVDALSESFDRYPELKADLAARISHLQYQSAVDRERVRNFLIKYQDRIIYGSDMSVNEMSADYTKVSDGMRRTWLNQWIYLATDSLVVMKDMPVSNIKGLQLPKEVIDKIFCKNAERFFTKRAL